MGQQMSSVRLYRNHQETFSYGFPLTFWERSLKVVIGERSWTSGNFPFQRYDNITWDVFHVLGQRFGNVKLLAGLQTLFAHFTLGNTKVLFHSIQMVQVAEILPEIFRFQHKNS